MPMEIIIGLGEYAISKSKEDVIKTYALSSCVAVTVHSPLRQVGGMIHIVLPDHKMSDSPQTSAGYYATLGLPYLVQKILNDFGCLKHELVIRLFGGASSIEKNDVFNIGNKNIEAITNILDEMKLNYFLSEVGGNISRTIEMDVASGAVKVYAQPIKV
ncbi:MAG: archease [Firmicutes bacterium HGW-Firmicutes-1]|jgi:chemotaxis protein CheD|nr:MAG: archease [Firmicutes bacterium HGW-Firmicutes-1]